VVIYLFAALWAGLVTQRLLEVRRAQRNTGRLIAEQGAREFAPGHYPVMVALHSAWFTCWLVELLFYGPPEWHAAWLPMALTGQALRWWAQNTLGARWTTRILVVPGERRVQSGPYRLLSHPNYAGVVLELWAFPMLFGAWRTALGISLANLWLLHWRIRCEEKALRQWTQSGS
jgi:methyltransferase